MLTEQQQAILETATAPGKRAKIFRVNAAAGTGKTTTLIALAQRLVKLGHSPCYIAFNRCDSKNANTKFTVKSMRSCIYTFPHGTNTQTYRHPLSV